MQNVHESPRLYSTINAPVNTKPPTPISIVFLAIVDAAAIYLSSGPNAPPDSPGNGAPLGPPPAATVVGAVGRLMDDVEVEVEFAETVLFPEDVLFPEVVLFPEMVLLGEADWVGASVDTKTMVLVPELICLSGPIVTKAERVVDVMTACEEFVEFDWRWSDIVYYRETGHTCARASRGSAHRKTAVAAFMAAWERGGSRELHSRRRGLRQN